MKRDSCECCMHAGDYWPMYVGDDERKWGTIKCARKRRLVLPLGCDKFEPEDKEKKNDVRHKDRKQRGSRHPHNRG